MLKQKIYKEIYGDILREKKWQKQKTKVSTQSWDEKKSIRNGEDILWRWKQKAIKEKGSGQWGHLLREINRHYQQKIAVSKDSLSG